MPDLKRLWAELQQVSGADKALDAEIAAQFGVPVADYSSSVPQCRTLLAEVLPAWRLHVGYDASGLFPYASLGNDGRRYSASAPTVPLAVLRAMVEVLRAVQTVAQV